MLATALVSQMLTEWAKLLHRDLGNEQVQPVYVELADQLVQGLKYVCDAALDAVPLLSKLSVSAVVLCRVLWLKRWSADQTSKKTLADLPFQGKWLLDCQIRVGRLTRASRSFGGYGLLPFRSGCRVFLSIGL